ncbi:uncharacterized protein PHACADRAFT_246464 [Phanerochaete carnosa HHB-10118-sp]|uniref:Uncharacterized protein n=1 Tax=Phanerochaete carnosa (strain HHB-10118-sp) TaxID=650164 RepID=K5WM20_PHACS|nr:uncharacterized protein PHACADRAFT_246464 [Phanerochaete carnosa HHB-10118-sp]EKM60480.1 hypothetical protein PHACADRAFT_246464 [Phanerochaete carnosa HHB-10118-sp]
MMQSSGARKAICSEFVKFGIYIKLWQLGVLTSSTRDPPQLTSDDISQAIQRLPDEYQEIAPSLDLTVDTSHLGRYEVIMADFLAEINRDEVTKKLWYVDSYVDEEQVRLAGQRPDGSEPSASLHGSTATTSSSPSTTAVAPEMVSATTPEGITVSSFSNGGTPPDAADGTSLPVESPGGGLVGRPATSHMAASGIHTRPAPALADGQVPSAFPPPTPSSADEEPTALGAGASGEGKKRAKTY